MKINVKTDWYKLEFELNDPDLIRKYEENPLYFYNLLQNGISNALEDLQQPDEVRDQLASLYRRFREAKMGIIEEHEIRQYNDEEEIRITLH